MSVTAIAAALALGDVSPSERLVAFSLASYANREEIAYPGNPAAAVRAGLSRSRYLHARDLLLRRGLISLKDTGGGRGRSTTVTVEFAKGPRFEGRVNPELFEVVLSYSGARGSARQLLAVMAAMSAEDGSLTGVTTEEICEMAGLADSTYRRARAVLLGSGDLLLIQDGGGRGVTNHWRIRDPRASGLEPARSRTARRQSPPAAARPLVASVNLAATADESDARGAEVRGPDLTRVSHPGNTGQTRTVSAVKGPDLSGVSAGNTAQTRTVSVAETPPQTPPETPPPNARTGREPQNQEPTPLTPQGGNRTNLLLLQETYVTDRGRQRHRTVRVDLAEIRQRLGIPDAKDRDDWDVMRRELVEIVGESTVEIWLQPLQLIAIDSTTGALVLGGPELTLAWVERRYGRAIERAATTIGRRFRIAGEIERQAMTAGPGITAQTPTQGGAPWSRPSRSRKAGWARPPPRSTSESCSLETAVACCSSTPTHKQR